MKIAFFILSFSVVIFLSSCSNNENNIETDKYKSELDSYANEYMLGLKSVLIKNMQQGGPIQAINVCSDTAADMTNLFSEQKLVKVKRSSFKNRNENNKPDSYEAKAISHFTALANNNELDDKTSLIEAVKIGEKDAIVYSKPIFIEAPCLNCHGAKEQISTEVAEFIKKKYPEDKATGYNIGDLRGIISVTKTL